MQKNIIYLATILFLWLLFLAFYFAADRILFSDMAYQEIFILFEKHPLYNWSRPGSIVLQLVPLSLQMLNLSLKSIVTIHSMSFIAYNFIGFLIIVFYQKRVEVAFALVFCLLLFMQNSFFWCQSEYQQGFIFLGFYAAFLANNLSFANLSKKSFLLTIILFNAWIMTYHPLIIFPLLFILLYYFYKANISGYKNMLLALFPFIVGIAFRVVIGKFNSYESGKMGLLSEMINSLKNITILPSLHSFFSIAYLSFFLLFGLIVFFLIIQRSYLTIILLLLFLIGYIGLILFTHPQAINHYSESMLMVVGFVIGLLFMDIVVANINFRYAIMLILLVAGYNSFLTLTNSLYTERLLYLNVLINQYTSSQHPKVVLSTKKINEQKLITNWATSYETVLLTAMSGVANAKELMIVNNPDEYLWMKDMDSSYAAIYSVYGQSKYPKNYIVLPKANYDFIY